MPCSRRGAEKVSINSAAVRDPEFVRGRGEQFGSQCIVVNIDPKRVQRDGREVWEVHINGGRISTGREAVAWAREVERLGAGEIVLTSMDADGTKNGYDLPMTRAVSEAVEIPVVASGGAEESRTPPRGPGRGGASAAWRPASSTITNTRSRRRRSIWPVTACRSGSSQRRRPLDIRFAALAPTTRKHLRHRTRIIFF